MSTSAPLTEAEIKQLVEDWYRALDVHAATVEMLPMVVEEGLLLRFPEGDMHGLVEFDRWYNGFVLRSYFDEVHTIKEVDVTLNTSSAQADVKIIVTWEASRWKPPAAKSERLRFDAYQTWTVGRSPQSGKPVIVSYSVDELQPLEGSVPL